MNYIALVVEQHGSLALSLILKMCIDRHKNILHFHCLCSGNVKRMWFVWNGCSVFQLCNISELNPNGRVPFYFCDWYFPKTLYVQVSPLFQEIISVYMYKNYCCNHKDTHPRTVIHSYSANTFNTVLFNVIAYSCRRGIIYSPTIWMHSEEDEFPFELVPPQVPPSCHLREFFPLGSFILREFCHSHNLALLIRDLKVVKAQ